MRCNCMGELYIGQLTWPDKGAYDADSPLQGLPQGFHMQRTTFARAGQKSRVTHSVEQGDYEDDGYWW